ncbi:MAG: DUF1924 domain-containing protein [Gammaproteobacteria bacterium]|nr:DUF1924 domain-containing protein [Gammaproteobacteria bacterium]MBU1416156.1 DUF1924 domain-containing protein [Gammaproteobacteria bacterium]
MKYLIPYAILVASVGTTAETPQQVMDAYTADAVRRTPGFAPNAGLGEFLFVRKFAVSATMPNCAACHADSPSQPGRHILTRVDIKPLSPAANPERFTDAAKVEKWFLRDCTKVIGRECTAGEKADFIAFVSNDY